MTKNRNNLTVARPIAPEDLVRGLYVAVLYDVHDFMPPFCDSAMESPRTQRVVWLPDEPTVPYRVLEVCVPFVLVERPDGRHETLDTRRQQLARLDDEFGRRSARALRSPQRRRKKAK